MSYKNVSQEYILDHVKNGWIVANSWLVDRAEDYEEDSEEEAPVYGENYYLNAVLVVNWRMHDGKVMFVTCDAPKTVEFKEFLKTINALGKENWAKALDEDLSRALSELENDQ